MCQGLFENVSGSHCSCFWITVILPYNFYACLPRDNRQDSHSVVALLAAKDPDYGVCALKMI